MSENPLFVLKHITETFEAAEKAHHDLMEPYAIRLAEAETNEEKIDIMRRGLRETIRQRVPLSEAREVAASAPDTQGALAL